MITLGRLGSNMDPTHHEKIVDKLMQYRGKIPKNQVLGDRKAMWTCDQMKNYIDELILEIDAFAKCFEQELIRWIGKTQYLFSVKIVFIMSKKSLLKMTLMVITLFFIACVVKKNESSPFIEPNQGNFCHITW